MDMYANLALGLSVALSMQNLLFCLIGVSLGMLVGVIPGLGPLAAMSLLLPMTFQLDPTTALIMLGGIYYGTAYGGSIAAILLNLPGITSSAIVCLDGYPMSQKGRAGVALLMTTLGSFFGGSVGIILMILLSPIIVKVALVFGPAEYFSLILFGLISSTTVSGSSLLKGIASVGLGILFGTVGVDMYSGAARFTFGAMDLYEGVSLVAVAMGLFGVAEVIHSIRNQPMDGAKIAKVTFRSMLPTREEAKASLMPMVRGAGIGSFFGILPGAGGSISSFMAYAIEKKVSRTPERFGSGAIEGVVAPETANNAADQTAFIPTLTLGIPGSAVMAVILGVLIIHGIAPGPNFVANRPDMFWGLVMSFWIGNLMLLVLNLPLIGIWVRILSIPYRMLYPAVIIFVCFGVYSVHYSFAEVLTVLFFGALGYVMRQLDFSVAPLLLGFVLGPMLEENFRRAMILSSGSFDVFVTRPVSLAFVIASVLVVLVPAVKMLRAGSRPAKADSSGAPQ